MSRRQATRYPTSPTHRRVCADASVCDDDASATSTLSVRCYKLSRPRAAMSRPGVQNYDLHMCHRYTDVCPTLHDVEEYMVECMVLYICNVKYCVAM